MKNVILSLCVLMSAGALAAPKAFVSADHADCLYCCGEKASLTVTVRDGDALVPTGAVKVVVDNFGPKRQLEKTYDLAKGNPFVVSATLPKPGFPPARARRQGEGTAGRNLERRFRRHEDPSDDTRAEGL